MSIFTLQSLAVGHLSARKGSIASRGTTIITQKENKGEYNGVHCDSETSCSGGHLDNGSIWYWSNLSYDWDIYAHVFDQNGPKDSDGTPYQYSTDISDWTNNLYWDNPDNIHRCTTMSLEENQKGHKNLYSGTPILSTDKACVANTHNAGNWYNFAAATAGSNNASTSTEKNMPNSICPKGWQLPPNDGNKSYNTLIRTTYNITDEDSDSTLLSGSAYSAMSFVRLGYYTYIYGSLDGRGGGGDYWSSTASSSVLSHRLDFYSGSLSPQNDSTRAHGFSIRCVAR